MRVDPMWLKTPLLLFRWPPILAAIGAGIAVLVVSTSVAPLFLSSAAGGALREQLQDLHPASAGLVVGQQTPLVPLPVPQPGGGAQHQSPAELHATRSRSLERLTAPVPHLAPMLATITTGEAILSGDEGGFRVQPLARDGFESHITVEEATTGRGAWVARSAADELGISPGDELQVDIDAPTTVRIKGIYSNLETEPVTTYWAPVDDFIHAPTPKAPPPPPPLLMDVPLLLELGSATQSASVHSWEFWLQGRGLTLEDGQRLGDQLTAILGRITDQDSAVGGLFLEPFTNTTLPEAVDAASETVTGVESPVQVLALIGALVALVLITISAHYVVQKRSIEFRLLVARGAGPGWIGLRAFAETFIPALLFGVIGAAVSWTIITVFGPGPIDEAAVQQAIVLGAASVVLSLVILGIATILAARRMTAVEHAATSHDAGFPWEIVLVLLAGLALYLIDRRGAIETEENGGGRVDILLVLFPLLGISGTALFLLRIGFSYLQKARAATARSSTPLFLAARRLAAASRSVMLFVGAAAVSVGMLVYSTGLVTSVRATTHAKTHVFVGSDVSVVISDPDPVYDARVPHTIVTEFDANLGDDETDVMGVEPGSFEEAAYWDADFAARSLGSLLDELDTARTSSLPVIAVGPDDVSAGAFDVMGHEVPIEVVGRAETWPGMSQGVTLLVADETALGEAAGDAGYSLASAEVRLWAKGPTDAVLAELERAGVYTQTAVSARDAAESSTLLSISWTFGLLRILGIVAGVMSIVGMLLYVASRHRARLVSYLLGRRMGLRKTEHRSALLIELSAMLAAALVLGGSLGLVATRLIYRTLDLLPTVPPAPLFRVPTLEVVAAALAFLVAAALGSRWIQRSSDAARPGEVMRLAD